MTAAREHERSRLTGRPLHRREDMRILRGEASYLDDVDAPGAAHVAFVRSPHAHARIEAVRVRSSPRGPLAVITAADLPGVRSFPVGAPGEMRTDGDPHPVLAEDVVRYSGQPVAAVVASSRALAEDAAELVEVSYEPLDPVVEATEDCEEMARFARSAGDVDGAFAAADAVVRRHYTIPRLVAAPIEPRGAVASYDPGRDELVVWCSAQDPHRPLAQLAHILDRPAASIRVIVPDVGGAFGSKGVIAAEVAALAAASIELRRPLKWVEDRAENFVGAYQGRGLQGEIELAMASGGRMLAIRARLLADLGAYLYTTTLIPGHTTAKLLCGCYAIPAAEVELVGVRTNKVPVGPYRGAGRPEAAYLLERTVDAAARELEIDPVELRRRNLITEFPHRTPLGWTYDSGDYVRCLERAVELVRPERGGDAERLRGSGVALFVERAGGQFESAEARVEPTGRVVIASGSSPHGQGHETTFAQLAADRLGVPVHEVELRFGDTAVVPPGVGTFASRSVAMGGSAVVLALDELRARCVELAGKLLGVGADEVEWSGGRFRAGDRELGWRELATAAHEGHAGAAEGAALEASARFSSDLVFSAGAYGAVVEIERATGILRVLRIAAVDDAGRIVNPLLAEGQVLGATVQGLGQALAEEARYDGEGQLRTASFADYSLLTAAEVPTIATDTVQTPSPLNPLGAKGIGEGGAIGTPAAVANAVVDALDGRDVDPPYTERKLWQALQEVST